MGAFQAYRGGARLAAAALLLQLAGCGGFADRIQARLDLKNGNLSYIAGNYRDAITHYDRAVSRVPTLSRAFLNRGYSEEALFRASESLDERRALADSAAAAFLHYRELIEGGHQDGGQAPDLERVEQHILTLYLDSQQAEKAMTLLESRLQSHPRDIASVTMLANLAMEQGNLDLALRWNRKRIEMEPGQPEAYCALAVMAWQFSYNNRVADDQRAALLDEGTEAAERAVELRPDYFEALIYANLLYREKAKYAANDAERVEFEKRYTDFEERARQAQKQPGVNDTNGMSNGAPDSTKD
jgi:tetratricopeptide (TPR) repeat protein